MDLEIAGRINWTMPEDKSQKYSEFRLYDFHKKLDVVEDIDSGELAVKLDTGVLTLINNYYLSIVNLLLSIVQVFKNNHFVLLSQIKRIC